MQLFSPQFKQTGEETPEVSPKGREPGGKSHCIRTLCFLIRKMRKILTL